MTDATCRQCNSPVAPGQTFCSRCGANLTGQVVIVHQAPPQSWAQRHLLLTIVLVVVVVACILPACAVFGLSALSGPIDAQFNAIQDTIQATLEAGQ